MQGREGCSRKILFRRTMESGLNFKKTSLTVLMIRKGRGWDQLGGLLRLGFLQSLVSSCIPKMSMSGELACLSCLSLSSCTRACVCVSGPVGGVGLSESFLPSLINRTCWENAGGDLSVELCSRVEIIRTSLGHNWLRSIKLPLGYKTESKNRTLFSVFLGPSKHCCFCLHAFLGYQASGS